YPTLAGLPPVFPPGQAGARALPVAPRFRPRLARREAAVPLDLGRARREERAEHAYGTGVESGRRVEHEGLAGVVPGQADAVGARRDGLDGGGARIAGARE